MTLLYRQGLIFCVCAYKIRCNTSLPLSYAPLVRAFAVIRLACILLRQMGLRIERNTALNFGQTAINSYHRLPSPVGEGVASAKCNEPSDG